MFQTGDIKTKEKTFPDLSFLPLLSYSLQCLTILSYRFIIFFNILLALPVYFYFSVDFECKSNISIIQISTMALMMALTKC